MARFFLAAALALAAAWAIARSGPAARWPAAAPSAPGSAREADAGAARRAEAEGLAAAGQDAAARDAWERAVAADPDDPEALLGAAGLLVERFGGDRASLAMGLARAQRGARLAAARGDRDLAARLLLVGAMAGNDLGRSREALADADEALRARPGDADLRYERGLALYELCRFAEADEELQRVLGQVPDDPWALHQLALVAERRGDAAAAEALARRAAALDPEELPLAEEPGPAAFAAEVRRAVARLPPARRRLLARARLEVADLPALEDLTASDPPLSPSILGLYRGPPLDEPCTAAGGPPCRSIVLYRKNLARAARGPEALAVQVEATLLHELGHLEGLDDDELRQRGLE